MNNLNIPFSPSRYDSTQFIVNFLDNKLNQKKIWNIADIGCGRLFFYSILLNHKVKGSYYGLDINPFNDVKKHPTLKTTVVKKDFLETSINKKFNLVCSFWVLEHIKDDKKAFFKLGSLLKENGILIIAVPSIYSWPIELGRHGFHYYSESSLDKFIKETDLIILEKYKSAGILGLLFMLIISWPRFFVLTLILPMYFVLKKTNLIKSSWQDFSKKVIYKTLYSYHNTGIGLRLHNKLVDKIVSLDNKFKIMSSSYILILKKI